MMEGICKGEICNRDECAGVIAEHHSEGSCSCHINPPCSFCTTSREYCPACGWDGREEQLEIEKEQMAINPTNEDFWQKQREESQKRQDHLHAQMRGELPIEKFDYENLSHTHFSMIKQGVYPNGMTRAEVEEKVKGTFGGRFEHFGNNKFKYIAYTD